MPFSSASTSFPGVPHAASLAPPSRSVDAGVPVVSAAHAVPVAPPPPVFDPLAHPSVPQFDDSAFDHGEGQFDEDAPYPLVPYPHTYIALYHSHAKLPVTHTHTHKNKKLLTIPLRLLPR